MSAPSSHPPTLVLGSTSVYRAQLLQRLGLTFQRAAPEVDETPSAGETPRDCAIRLARAKARSVAARHPGCVVIGSDQVADFDGRVIGKPGDEATANAQLLAFSGRSVDFHTALCVIGVDGQLSEVLDTTRVVFRTLDAESIARYVAIEHPLDCAGSFRCEGLGISLFERIESTDPTSLIGLPLIALSRLLRAHGYLLP